MGSLCRDAPGPQSLQVHVWYAVLAAGRCSLGPEDSGFNTHSLCDTAGLLQIPVQGSLQSGGEELHLASFVGFCQRCFKEKSKDKKDPGLNR